MQISLIYPWIMAQLKKADKIAVVPVDMAWYDLGSWESICQKQTKDADLHMSDYYDE